MTIIPMTEQAATPVSLNVESIGLTPDQFLRLCADNRELRLELTARKELIVMLPAGGESSARNLIISRELGIWTKANAAGIAFDSTGGFVLPNGSIRSPDSSWIPRDRWDALSRVQKRGFLPLCPDFVIELRSPSDRLRTVKEKMAEYMANGARLGWLIDPSQKRAEVYRPGQPVQYLENPDSISADPDLPGFVLDLSEIWSD